MTEETQAWRQSLKQLKLMDKAHQARKKVRDDPGTYTWTLKSQQLWPGWAGASVIGVPPERLRADSQAMASEEEVIASDLTELYCLLRNTEGQLFNLGAEHSAYMLKAFALQVIRPLCESYEAHID